MATLSPDKTGCQPRPVAEVLAEAYASNRDQPIDAAIALAFASELTRQVRDAAPKLAIEIGMANGLSSLAILAGLQPGGRLISIDPFQDTQWHDEGRRLVAKTDRANDHTLIQDFDYLALPDLLRQGAEVDFAYIDGMHTFDYVALDAFFVDRLLKVGGVVAFNDCGFRSIHKYLRFFRNHRHYAELDTHLPHDFRGRNPLVTLLRRAQGRSNQDRYFKKLDRWEGDHNFFRNF